MSIAPASPGDHVICYRLKQELGCVKLRLWEPPGASNQQETRDLPFLYAVNFTFNTLLEAEAFLQRHLLTNGAFDVPATDFPEEGKIEILPFPTWGRDHAP